MSGEYGGISSFAFNSNQSNNNGLGTLYGYMPKIKSGSESYNPGIASVEDSISMSNPMNNQSLQNELFKSQIDMNKVNIANAKGSDMTFDQAQGLGGIWDWATANRGGGSSYAKTGLGVLSAGADLWTAYNQNKYQKKMGDLAERQQNIYEQQLAKQEVKQNKAQAAYDAAQDQTV